ncbi:piriformospora indica-insensitive protein 2-like [Andrographis paniculata]|uniref:piriformospora indica-insensitive protein 2-like n=1 Tax=Andrographis paniculata TaxID=175694 RepID=UPI0021E70792|nr:piriformospora indica-insensitive protein 2-like [Andrographis paniculata]
MESLNYFRALIVVLCLLFALSLNSSNGDHNNNNNNNNEDEDDDDGGMPSSSPMKISQKEALFSAIQGFVGKWWNGSHLYPDPCGWTPIQGVSCDFYDGFWYVTELRIGPVHDNSLRCSNEKIEFPHQLFDLIRLKTLSFFNCFVSGRPANIPAENWGFLAGSLESLEFRSNPGLAGEVPEGLGKLEKLESLVIMENSLTGELPESIGRLRNLRRLNLAGNLFSGGIPAGMTSLDRLLILDLSNNSLSGFLPESFSGLVSVMKLDLSNNNLSGNIPAAIGNLDNLTVLDFRNNRFSGGLPKSLERLTSLEELALSGNPIGGEISGVDWRRLAGLTALDLANANLSGNIPAGIGEIRRLRFLGLNDNNLTGEISPDLAKLPEVSSMYFHGNNLRGRLPFSEGFYRRLGRRFGGWDNPGLCCPVGSVSEKFVPIGVKICRRGGVVTTGRDGSTVEIESWGDQDSRSTAGFASCFSSVVVVLMEVLFVVLIWQ